MKAALNAYVLQGTCESMRPRLKRFLKIFLIVLLAALVYPLWWMSGRADLSAFPPLESGDLIFQTSMTNQTLAIVFATSSAYTHVGIVHAGKEGTTVIHASAKVKEVSLQEFVNRGIGGHVLIMRYPGLSAEQREHLVTEAQRYLDREYDRVFSLNNEAIYCSELPYLVFGAEKLSLGRVQQLRELDMDHWAVRSLFSKRWRLHPACQSEFMTMEECWKAVMDEKIITPVSIVDDTRLTTIYSNY